MDNAFVLRPGQRIPKKYNNPLVQIKEIKSVKCPLCDYQIRIHYLILPENHLENDIKNYEKSLEAEHKKNLHKLNNS